MSPTLPDLDVPTTPFGTVFAPQMASVRFDGEGWSEAELHTVDDLALHPASHVLHYGSACFEGLKAHRGADGRVRVFRADRHAERMRRSAELLMLPVPEPSLVERMITEVVVANLDHVPPAPGSLYLRPTLIGTLPNIGAAAAPSTEALLFVLASPVGDYFVGGLRGLRIAIETDRPRTTPQFGMVKTGANYAMALRITQEAKRSLGADQVLFAPQGTVQETGASNFLLLDDTRVVSPPLDGSLLHGVTRDSILTLAADLGYEVEERPLPIDEVLAWARQGEAALAGTAAVLAPVGAFLHQGEELAVGDGEPGPNTLRLREALTAIHTGEAPDPHGWTREISG